MINLETDRPIIGKLYEISNDIMKSMKIFLNTNVHRGTVSEIFFPVKAAPVFDTKPWETHPEYRITELALGQTVGLTKDQLKKFRRSLKEQLEQDDPDLMVMWMEDEKTFTEEIEFVVRFQQTAIDLVLRKLDTDLYIFTWSIQFVTKDGLGADVILKIMEFITSANEQFVKDQTIPELDLKGFE